MTRVSKSCRVLLAVGRGRGNHWLCHWDAGILPFSWRSSAIQPGWPRRRWRPACGCAGVQRPSARAVRLPHRVVDDQLDPEDLASQIIPALWDFGEGNLIVGVIKYDRLFGKITRSSSATSSAIAVPGTFSASVALVDNRFQLNCVLRRRAAWQPARPICKLQPHGETMVRDADNRDPLRGCAGGALPRGSLGQDRYENRDAAPDAGISPATVCCGLIFLSILQKHRDCARGLHPYLKRDAVHLLMRRIPDGI